MLSTFLLIILLGNITCVGVGAQPTVVSILPESYTAPNIGLNFTVNISIQNVNNLYAWELTLYYPNDILNGTAIDEGPFLKTGNQPTFFHIIEFNETYNNTHGRITALCSRLKPDTPGASGDGVLATITFTSKSTNGPKTLHLEDVHLFDSNSNEIPCTTTNSEVTVIPELPTTLTPLILAASTILAIAIRKATQQRKMERMQNHVLPSSTTPHKFQSQLQNT